MSQYIKFKGTKLTDKTKDKLDICPDACRDLLIAVFEQGVKDKDRAFFYSDQFDYLLSLYPDTPKTPYFNDVRYWRARVNGIDI